MATSFAVVPIGISLLIGSTPKEYRSAIVPLSLKINQRESITTAVLIPLGVTARRTLKDPAKATALDEESNNGYPDLNIGTGARIVVDPAIVAPPW